MKDTECTQVQCIKCHTPFCWVCLSYAKGQMHYKQNPQCKNIDANIFQADYLSQKMKDDASISEHNDYINLRFCAKCPYCNGINEKKTKCNALKCTDCEKLFCYICNKAISGPAHYQGAKTMCHYESDHWNDL